MLINSGDFNLPTDLLYRLIEWKMKREWKNRRFSSIDFVSCATFDMYKNDQHPLYARHIARSKNDSDLVTAVHYLYDRWVHYGAAALGLAVSYQEGDISEAAKVNLTQPFIGKILYDTASEN